MASTSGQSNSAKDHEQDLSSILTTEERVELTLLIANITELMRQQIKDTFDASFASGKQPQQGLHLADKNPNVDDSKPQEETEEEETARKLRENREKELSAPKMLDLKGDALKFFDSWRESVISRVGIAVNNPKEVVKNQKNNASVEATPRAAPSAEPKRIREFELS